MSLITSLSALFTNNKVAIVKCDLSEGDNLTTLANNFWIITAQQDVNACDLLIPETDARLFSSNRLCTLVLESKVFQEKAAIEVSFLYITRMENGNAIPGDVWYYSLWSLVQCLLWDDVKRASIVKAILKFVCLPCSIVYRALVGRRSQEKFAHSGIVYFYILLCSTVVFNLWLVITKQPSSNHLLQWYESLCMWLSILGFFYIYLTVRGNAVVFNREGMAVTFYLRTGLYIFGVLGMGYSLCLFMNYLACHDNCCKDTLTKARYATVQITKAFFIVVEILFLNSFYQVELPIDTPYVQIVLAHLLGTNMSLWFWTLCQEVHNPAEEICRSFPTPVGKNVAKIFYSVFVEYYLLAASMFYEIWSSLKEAQSSGFDMNHLLFADGEQPNYGAIDNQSGEILREDPRPPAAERRNNRRTRSNGGSTLVFGLSFGVVFLVFVIASEHVGTIDHFYYEIFLWVTCADYVVEIMICFILHICVQTQRNSGRITCDYDDGLLYIGLAGIVLWDGFHFYALFSSSLVTLDVGETLVDFLGPVQYITQTVTIVIIRRYQSSYDKNSKWICYCALFLLANNFATWCQDTFFIEGSGLQKPGENNIEQLKEHWEVLARILNPLIIFFRFQSATCLYQVWSLYKIRDEQQMIN